MVGALAFPPKAPTFYHSKSWCFCSSGGLKDIPGSKAKSRPAKAASRAAVTRGVIASSSDDDNDDDDENKPDSMVLSAPTGMGMSMLVFFCPIKSQPNDVSQVSMTKLHLLSPLVT